MKILITGIAGFIGFHVAQACLERGDEVYGIDNLNDYYDPKLKKDRLKELNLISKETKSSLSFFEGDISDNSLVKEIFKNDFNRVINLAAQAGVRKSLEEPLTYISSNIIGFVNILEGCRDNEVKHLTYASTSSVYGLNSKLPFSEEDRTDHPIQLYAASKKSNELLAHSYSHLFNLPTTGLRFFTVYGPWGRPDMALFLFTKAIIEGKEIEVFNKGDHSRDFTYIDDIVQGILLASDDIASPNPEWDGKNPETDSSKAPYRLFNIGNGNRVSLNEYIQAIEQGLNKKAIRNLLPLQPGDVPDSLADISSIQKLGYKPSTDYKKGVQKFLDWYQTYYKINN